MGIVEASVEPKQRVTPVLPRITLRRPRHGFMHPAGRADVRRILEFIGPEAFYGITHIELAQVSSAAREGLPPLGRLVVPGKIVVYEQPVPPWNLVGVLSRKDSRRLQHAGALLEVSRGGATTTVEWSGSTLRDFMLFDVLLHELGHHILQHHTGKRTARIARTRDHESFAERFAERCRAAWLESEEAK